MSLSTWLRVVLLLALTIYLLQVASRSLDRTYEKLKRIPIDFGITA